MTEQRQHAENARKGFLFALAGTILIATYFVTWKYALTAFNTATFCFLGTANGVGQLFLRSVYLFICTRQLCDGGRLIARLLQDSVGYALNLGVA